MLNDLVIGIDPGSRWTAAVLRHGDRAVHGWTLGPVDAAGQPARDAVDDPDDLAALGRYVDRLTEAVAELEERAEKEFGARPLVAIEAVVVPEAWRNRRLALVDWLTPRSVVVGVMALYPNVVLVEPAGGKASPRRARPLPYGKRAPEAYPGNLKGKPPADWGPVESRRRERDHERAAYDVAGVAMRAQQLRSAA